jgi:hypothetical protein
VKQEASEHGHGLSDVRSDKDKAKAGVPQLPGNAKNKLISVPYAFLCLEKMQCVFLHHQPNV